MNYFCAPGYTKAFPKCGKCWVGLGCSLCGTTIHVSWFSVPKMAPVTAPHNLCWPVVPGLNLPGEVADLWPRSNAPGLDTWWPHKFHDYMTSAITMVGTFGALNVHWPEYMPLRRLNGKKPWGAPENVYSASMVAPRYRAMVVGYSPSYDGPSLRFSRLLVHHIWKWEQLDLATVDVLVSFVNVKPRAWVPCVNLHDKWVSQILSSWTLSQVSAVNKVKCWNF